MKVEVLNEYGHLEALLGLSLSYGTTIEKAAEVAKKLAHKDGGHNKYLRSITVYLDINAPRYWWQQFAEYKIGVTNQSESTIHSLMKKPLTFDDFDPSFESTWSINEEYLIHLNHLIKAGLFEEAKGCLPESFLQRRIICTNYAAIKNMVEQRQKHKLKEWKYFCKEIIDKLEHKEYTKGWLKE